MKYAKFIKTDLTNTDFSGTPTIKFIRRRNKIIEGSDPRQRNLAFRFSAEYPEHHQCEIDPNQTLSSVKAYDTDHSEYGHIDYKLFSKEGVHLSGWIMEQILLGNIDYLAIWKWNNNPSGIVYEGKEVSYKILGLINARDALEALDPHFRGKSDLSGRIGGRFFIDGLHPA